MNKVSSWVLVAAAFALLGAAMLVAHSSGSVVPKPSRVPTADALRYELGSGQLSAIEVQEVKVFPVPLAEPLNGRVTRTAVRLPNTALVTEGLYSYVFVEQSPGVFKRRRVQLAVQDRDYSYLASGVEPAERVVVAGAVLLNRELGAAAQ